MAVDETSEANTTAKTGTRSNRTSARRKKKTTSATSTARAGEAAPPTTGTAAAETKTATAPSTKRSRRPRTPPKTPVSAPAAAPPEAPEATPAARTPTAEAPRKKRATRPHKKKAIALPAAEDSATKVQGLVAAATPVATPRPPKTPTGPEAGTAPADAPAAKPAEALPGDVKRRRKRGGRRHAKRMAAHRDQPVQRSGVSAPAPTAPPTTATAARPAPPTPRPAVVAPPAPARPAPKSDFGVGLFDRIEDRATEAGPTDELDILIQDAPDAATETETVDEPVAVPTRERPAALEPRTSVRADAGPADEEIRPAVAEPVGGPARRGRRGRRNRHSTNGSTAPVKAADTEPKPAIQAKPAPLPEAEPTTTGNLEMIINVAAGDECRIAVLEGGRLQELFIERQSAESHVNSIYKGRVTNVEPSIGAVFVDFGFPKNGFLHISDVHPKYFPNGGGSSEDVGRKIPRRERPPIQKCFRRGQEVVVQVTKEGIGTKGPSLTSYLSIPGRFLVMMPGMSRLGVSRKIEDDAARRTMRELLNELELPEGIGFILRTAGLGRTKRELQRDLTYLSRLWKIIADRIQKLRAPAEVYQESDLVIRTIRDVLTSDFKRVVVDNEEAAENAREFLKIALPRSQDIVEVYTDHQPIFHRFGIEQEIERINARHVPLPSGGSIVIEQTEAMVAIDVNSGKFREVDDAEKSALQINLQAAEEIARQLRLRDLGGLIVCDFIDMRLEKHKRAVERALRNALKKHKERARILRISAFGLIEITRQRQRSSIRRSIYSECPHCRGSGTIKSVESMALEVLRVLQLVSHQETVRKVSLRVSPEVATLVQNQRRARLYDLETHTGARIVIHGDPTCALDQLSCECEDVRGRPVAPAL